MLSAANKPNMLCVIRLNTVMMSVIMLCVIMLNALMKIAIMPSVIMLSVIMLSFMAPKSGAPIRIYYGSRLNSWESIFMRKFCEHSLCLIYIFPIGHSFADIHDPYL